MKAGSFLVHFSNTVQKPLAKERTKGKEKRISFFAQLIPSVSQKYEADSYPRGSFDCHAEAVMKRQNVFKKNMLLTKAGAGDEELGTKTALE